MKQTICLDKNVFKKIRWTKRIKIYLLPLLLLLISTVTLSQNVSFKGNNVPLNKVLTEFKKQTGYAFLIKSGMLDKAKKVTLDIKNIPLTDALDLVFRDQPFTYSIVGKVITLSEKPQNNLSFNVATERSFFTAISGSVHNTRNQPVDGASIIIRGTKDGTLTNAKGEFTLKNVKPSDTLAISMIGYNTERVSIAEQTYLSIILKDASNKLDEVVKTAYGRTSQRFTTGDISKVTAAEIEKQPVMNPLLALQGRVPGLVVTPVSGFASAPVKIQIRGLNSLSKSVPSDPLYIIDGVPLTVSELVDPRLIPGGGRVSAGFSQAGIDIIMSGDAIGQSPLFSMDPDNIESIEILKDADATAVYGSRGSNGVILITTKKGKPGNIKFDFHIDPPFLSIGKNTRHIKMLNTQQYLEMRREAFKNSGQMPTLTDAPDLLYWDTTRYIDWQKATNGGTARNLNVSAGISGGNELTSFRINTNYTRQTNTTNISGATQRIALGSNLNSSTANQKFSFNLSTNFTYSKVDVVTPVLNPWFAPNAPPVFGKDGNPTWAEWNVGGLVTNNIYPFGVNLSPANPQTTTFLTSSLMLNYKPFKGFVFSTILGYNFAYNTTNGFQTIASQSPFLNERTGIAQFGITQNSGWTINPQISYNVKIGKSDFQFGLIATEQFVATNISSQLGYNYISDILLGSINNAGISFPSNKSARSKNASFVGQVNYIYDQKYILNLVGTRQGSSKFGPDNKYGSFGSIGVGWIASEENWLDKILPSFISFLKFRGSYGLTGSDGVGDYQYLPLWGYYTPLGDGGYDNKPILLPSVRPNQKYKWENNAKLEAAINIGLFKDKITLTAAYYRNRISNQLTTYPTPDFLNSSGTLTGIVTNVPLLLQNSGVEGTITAKLVTTSNFNLSGNFVVSRNKNVLLEFPNLENTPYAGQYTVGQSLNTIYLFHFLGVDPLTGNPSFKDYNNNGVLDYNYFNAPLKGSDDRQIIYDLQPKFTGGLGFTGNYKAIGFTVFFSYKKQIGKNFYGNLTGAGNFNQNIPEEYFNNVWRKPGDNAAYPKFSVFNVGNEIRISDGIYTDASYIRLTNLSFSYNIPESWSGKIGMKNLKASVNAQNVFVITRYKGGDPETGDIFPPAKLYTFRIDYSF